MVRFVKLIKNEKGATAIEYGLIAALIAVAAIGAMQGIGINCQWQSHCIALQRRAMRRALNYVADMRPPQWRVQLCNRNANRGGYRVDWVGFDHCIRNSALKRLSTPKAARLAHPHGA